ncbi:MAG: hypothetical protein ABJA83_11015 [Burkholderiaceae bacterium]
MKSFHSLSSAMLVAAAILIHPSHAAAQYSDDAFEDNFPSAANEVAELEKQFWMCDYAATAGHVVVDDAVPCSVIYEALKRLKFDGDFELLTDWWRESKFGEHEALERAHQAQAVSEGTDLAEFPDSI